MRVFYALEWRHWSTPYLGLDWYGWGDWTATLKIGPWIGWVTAG